MLEPNVSSASAYEFEDTIAAVENADVIAIEPQDGRLAAFARQLSRPLKRIAGMTVSVQPGRREVALNRDYDLFFVRVLAPHGLDFLDALPGWRERSRLAVCWVEELWLSWLKYGRALEPLRKFDHVFVGHAATAEVLGRVLGRPCTYLPPGVDALRFCPYPGPPERTISVYGMGRRSPDTHKVLLDRARADRKFMYLYDSARLSAVVEGPAQHRELLAELTRRSRYFVVNCAKANRRQDTEDQQEFGPRYFEGAAGGAVLIGDAPSSGPFTHYFDWPDALFRLPYGSTEIVKLFDELEAQPARVAAARKANVLHALRRHDWSYRWQTVLDALGMPATAAAAARKAELERRALEVEDRPQVAPVAAVMEAR